MPHTLEMHQVDAFTQHLFSGNPAAVIKLDQFLPDAVMQNISMENNLAETAFVVPQNKDNHYDLRWFTPTVEIDFCGHATVATAHILRTEYNLTPPFHFHTQVGELIVDVKDELYVMDAPVFPAHPTDITPAIRAAFPVKIKTAFKASADLYVVLDAAEDVRRITPDMSLILPLSKRGVGITAMGDQDYDCVSRFFVPAQGIDEDPVTGSAHAAIGPFWAQQLGQTSLTAYQASDRGGVLYLDICGERMTISGHAVTYMQGRIFLPKNA